VPYDVARTLDALSADDPQDTPAMSAVCASYRASHTTNATFNTLTSGQLPQPGDVVNQLAADLDLVAKCVTAGVPTQVYSVHLGDFDTHGDERDTQQDLLGKLDDALTRFLGQLRGQKRGRNVVVLVYSEFGRRVAANASQGTDHGSSGALFVTGTPVKGGFYGDQPSLTDLSDGDLKMTVDFRDVYYELLTGTLRTDPTPVVAGSRRELGFL
jgi:uncharacterized protein (DUF1501 family)